MDRADKERIGAGNLANDGAVRAMQAHEQAWEMVRERYIILPPETESA